MPIEKRHENVLILSHKIREVEHSLKVARQRRALSNISIALGPLLLIAIYILFWTPWIDAETKRIVLIPAF